MKKSLKLVLLLVSSVWIISGCKKEDNTIADPGFKTNSCVLATDSSDLGIFTFTNNANNQITSITKQGRIVNITYAGDSAFCLIADTSNGYYNSTKEVFFKEGTIWKKTILRITTTYYSGAGELVITKGVRTITPTYSGDKVATTSETYSSASTVNGVPKDTFNTFGTTTFTYNSDGNLVKWESKDDTYPAFITNIKYSNTSVSSSNVALNQMVYGYSSPFSLTSILGYFTPFNKMPASISENDGSLTFSNVELDDRNNILSYQAVGTGNYVRQLAVKSTFKCK